MVSLLATRTTLRRFRTLLLTLCLGFAALPVAAGELQVFAAASLTEVFGEIGRRFEATTPGDRIVFNFAGSQTLRTQIEYGARVDLFASADRACMEALVAQRLVEPPIRFAENRLVMIVNRSTFPPFAQFADTARPGLLLAVGAPEVPVGRYTRRLLERLAGSPEFGSSFVAAFRNNVASEEVSVKAVVAKVLLGEVDAGVVYATDVTDELLESLKVIPLPEEQAPRVRYPVAVLAGAAEKVLAERFLDFLLGTQGQSVLRTRGFSPAGGNDG